MIRATIPAWVLTVLLAIALVTPIAICVVGGVAALLSALGDVAGAKCLARTALAGGLFWSVDLVCLLLALAIHTIGEKSEPLE